MQDRTGARLLDIIDSIQQIETLLADIGLEDLQSDRIRKAAFERFLEILSEATRHIPQEMKASAPDIQWRRIGDIGNHIRHAYDKVDLEILWKIYESGEIAKLQNTVVQFIARLNLTLPKQGPQQ
jgi:uncharacterized protein with HEPN domain